MITWKKNLAQKKEEWKGMQKILYDENREYKGSQKDGKKHGMGILIGQGELNGQVYEGEIENDKFSGKGIYYKPNGDNYQG